MACSTRNVFVAYIFPSLTDRSRQSSFALIDLMQTERRYCRVSGSMGSHTTSAKQGESDGLAVASRKEKDGHMSYTSAGVVSLAMDRALAVSKREIESEHMRLRFTRRCIYR